MLHYGEWELFAVQLGDFLQDSILMELEILPAQRTHGPMRLVVQYLRIKLHQIDADANYMVFGGGLLPCVTLMRAIISKAVTIDAQ